MYSPDAKFKEHHFNISRDILDWVLYCFSETTYDVITYISKTKKDILKRKTPFFYTLKGLWNKQQFFLLHRHFNRRKKTTMHMIENRCHLFLSVIEIVVRGGLALKAYNKTLTEGIKLIFSLISMENYHMKRPSRCCCNGANCRAVGVKTGLCSYVTSSMNAPYRLKDTEESLSVWGDNRPGRWAG